MALQNKGIEPSFEQQLQVYTPALRNFSRTLAPTPEAAEDLAQDCIVKALDKQHLYKPGTNLKSWLFKIMYNHFCNNYKRGKRMQKVDTADVPHLLKDAGNQEDSIRLIRTRKAFAALKPKYKQALYLSVIEGLSYEGIADTLDIEIGTVKSRIARARRKLLKNLEKTRLNRQQANENNLRRFKKPSKRSTS